MARPRLLDLFCGAGGAAMGYWRAGFDVTGVDNRPQPRYPFRFVQADAMTFPLDGFDAIHASPPCQDHMRSRNQDLHGTAWMLDGTRVRLAAQSALWIIENVPGAPMRADYKLCGCMFGLPNLRRERWFETSWFAFALRQPCLHVEPVMSVTGNSPGKRGEKDLFGRWPTREDWRRAMGVDWMTAGELAQAIPPAYTEYIGGQLMLECPAQEPAGRGSGGGG
jgi:DNA (cytosine-5)-methyltransferase 1